MPSKKKATRKQKDVWELIVNGSEYTARSTVDPRYFATYNAEKQSVELLKRSKRADYYERMAQSRIDRHLTKFVVRSRGSHPESDYHPYDITDWDAGEFDTLEEADKAARECAERDVDEHNNPPPPMPKPKGSFTRDGEEKECSECGGWGEECRCWEDEEE